MGEWPFLGTEAIAAGTATKRTLQTRHQMIYRNVYLPRDATLTPATRAISAWLWSGRQATVAGLSAAALLGARWIDPNLPAELNRTESGTNGIVIHREKLTADEVCEVRGIPVTTPARTAFDLGRRPGFETAVIRLDALSNATGLCPVDVESLARQHRGARGIVQLRQVLGVMDSGSESPQESRTRLLLVRAKLPRPGTQIVVVDEWGHPIARVDMGWDEWRVGVEFDGAQHWTDPVQRTRDIDRYAELERLGWRIVRVSSEMLRRRPWVIVERVSAALRAAECGVEGRISRRNVA